MPDQTCSFCDATASFGPYARFFACRLCANRIAALALRGELRAPTIEVPDAVVPEAVKLHLDLALAYRDKSLYVDADREATFAIAAAKDPETINAALVMLLSRLEAS